MEQISIVTGTPAVLDTLSYEMSKEFTIEVVDKKVNLTAKGPDEKAKITNILSKVIIKEYEKKILLRLIEQNYCYFNKYDKLAIYKNALQNIDLDNKAIVSYRNSIIYTKLKEYLNTSNDIVIDGFVNFRLREYEEELQEIIDIAVEDFLVEKEYQEFIKLLKYFVSVQVPRYNVVHIRRKNNGYIILNEQEKDITEECIAEFKNEYAAADFKLDDLLLSAMISMAPNKIYVHQAEKIENKELLRTLESIFENKLIKID